MEAAFLLLLGLFHSTASLQVRVIFRTDLGRALLLALRCLLCWGLALCVASTCSPRGRLSVELGLQTCCHLLVRLNVARCRCLALLHFLRDRRIVLDIAQVALRGSFPLATSYGR